MLIDDNTNPGAGVVVEVEEGRRDASVVGLGLASVNSAGAVKHDCC